MKVASLILSTLLGHALAAPAIVWTSGSDGSSIHTSETLTAASLMTGAANVPKEDSSLASVVFLLGRADDGSETLSGLASAGALPGVASKMDAAHVHHHVSGIESSYAIASLARTGLDEHRVLEISLNEFNRKMTSLKDTKIEQIEVGEDGHLNKAENEANQRERALALADVIVVDVASNTDASKIDSAVVSAIENASVKNVVLAGIRSTDEVKLERTMASRRRMTEMKSTTLAGRRRLDQNAADGDDANGGGNEDMTGVYYVAMTPNMLAGILFALFFTGIAFTGISCMGMIQGGDVYVKKYPSIGREA